MLTVAAARPQLEGRTVLSLQLVFVFVLFTICITCLLDYRLVICIRCLMHGPRTIKAPIKTIISLWEQKQCESSHQWLFAINHSSHWWSQNIQCFILIFQINTCTICIVLIYAILFVFSGNNKTFAICKNKCAPKIKTSLAEWLTSSESLGDQRLLWWCLVLVNPCAPSDCCPWNVASLWTRTLIRTDCFEVGRVIIWLTEWGHSVFQVVEGI